jgi:pyrimidine operon attenuation protein/uracil phosphoribosyltransferase
VLLGGGGVLSLRVVERVVAQGELIGRTIQRMAAQIAESFVEGSWVLVGIQARGYAFAQRLQKALEELLGRAVPLGGLDVTFYRDDIGRSAQLKVPHPSQLPFSVEGASIWLIDDVLWTGRTVRAALEALRDLGRPARVRLAVLVDRRGHRELPIVPDCVGYSIDTTPQEKVLVRIDNDPPMILVRYG